MMNTDLDFTTEQYESLGRLVRRWAQPGNRYTFVVQSEIASKGATMLCTVADTSGEHPLTIVHGIEADGYCHT